MSTTDGELLPLSQLVIRPEAFYGLEEVEFEGYDKRDPLLPRIYRWKKEQMGTYPHRRKAPPGAPQDSAPDVGETYFTFYDPSAAGKDNLRRIVDQLSIPKGRDDVVVKEDGEFYTRTLY